MSDTIEPINLEKEAVRPLEIQGRTAIYVFWQAYKNSRQLTRFGEVLYTSQKGHFSLLYVNDEEIEDIITQLKSLKFVRKVKISHLKEMNTNFSEAFAETNEAVRKEMKEAQEETAEQKDYFK